MRNFPPRATVSVGDDGYIQASEPVVCETLRASPEPAPDMNRLVRILAARVLAGFPAIRGIEMSDLIQAGNIGLLQATRTFSPQNGAPLAGYAKFRIRGEMLDAVRRNTRSGAARVSRLTDRQPTTASISKA